MMARMTGRVTGVRFEQGTGVAIEVRVDTQYGNITVYKPDVWMETPEQLRALLGENVTVSVTVEL